MNLQEKYEVSSRDVFLASAVRNIKVLEHAQNFCIDIRLRNMVLKII